MKAATKRGVALGGLLLILGSGVGLILRGLNESIVFYVTPSEITPQHHAHKIRLGGLVTQESIHQNPKTGQWTFSLHDDTGATITVQFEGLPPALFQEEKGIVAEGRFQDPTLFHAERLLAKHDETYKPPSPSPKSSPASMAPAASQEGQP